MHWQLILLAKKRHLKTYRQNTMWKTLATFAHQSRFSMMRIWGIRIPLQEEVEWLRACKIWLRRCRLPKHKTFQRSHQSRLLLWKRRSLYSNHLQTTQWISFSPKKINRRRKSSLCRMMWKWRSSRKNLRHQKLKKRSRSLFKRLRKWVTICPIWRSNRSARESWKGHFM